MSDTVELNTFQFAVLIVLFVVLGICLGFTIAPIFTEPLSIKDNDECIIHNGTVYCENGCFYMEGKEYCEVIANE